MKSYPDMGKEAEVQALVEAALTGDLQQLGWFRNLTPDGQALVSRVVHMDASDSSDTVTDALMRMAVAVLPTGYKVMLGQQAERIVTLQARSLPTLCSPT